jgi:hypothetical protein
VFALSAFGDEARAASERVTCVAAAAIKWQVISPKDVAKLLPCSKRDPTSSTCSTPTDTRVRWRTTADGLPPATRFLNAFTLRPRGSLCGETPWSWVGYKVHLTETCPT